MYTTEIFLNEILPNPKKGEDEYIEIFNDAEQVINLDGWALKDASKSGKYVFPEKTSVESGGYLTVRKKDFKFALNNTGTETVSLFNPLGEAVSMVTYSDSKKNVSYNFDGKNWHWSRFLTPGKENKFNQAPKIKINKIKKGNVGMEIVFEAKIKDKNKDKLKYAWDFGDGRKSYLKNTKHVYTKKGKYTVTLTVDDGSDKFSKSFKIKIEKYPHSEVVFTRLIPNPEGNDTGKEAIFLKNNSGKNVSLKGWKIATVSSGKKFVNHNIISDLQVGSGEEIKLTKSDAAFYLHNEKMKLELRYPDGKTADKIVYEKEKISDNETYILKSDGWFWEGADRLKALKEESEQESENEAEKKDEIVTQNEDATSDDGENESEANIQESENLSGGFSKIIPERKLFDGGEIEVGLLPAFGGGMSFQDAESNSVEKYFFTQKKNETGIGENFSEKLMRGLNGKMAEWLRMI